MQDCTLLTTFINSGTVVTANLLHADFAASARGSTANECDPEVFLNLEEVNGKGRKWGIATSLPDILSSDM